MYRHLLVPTDGSALSLRAVKTAARMAISLGSKISVVHVVPPWAPPVYGDPLGYLPLVSDPKEFKASVERSAQRVLAAAVRRAESFGVSCGAVLCTHEHPWEGILKTARSRRCDLIVMASHGRRGLAGVLLGSETARLLTHSRIPVLVCK